MRRVLGFALPALLSGVFAASADPDCTADRKDFSLSSTSGPFIWKGIRLSVAHYPDTAFRNGGSDYKDPAGGATPTKLSLGSMELVAVSLQDTPSLIRAGRIKIASNVSKFARAMPINFGGIDVADLSFCPNQQVNLHCGSITFYASENAMAMKCTLNIFDPADIVTP